MASTAARAVVCHHSFEVTKENCHSVVVAEFLALVPPGAAVRATATLGGDTVTSSVVFLTDTAACLPRTGQATTP